MKVITPKLAYGFDNAIQYVPQEGTTERLGYPVELERTQFNLWLRIRRWKINMRKFIPPLELDPGVTYEITDKIIETGDSFFSDSSKYVPPVTDPPTPTPDPYETLTPFRNERELMIHMGTRFNYVWELGEDLSLQRVQAALGVYIMPVLEPVPSLNENHSFDQRLIEQAQALLGDEGRAAVKRTNTTKKADLRYYPSVALSFGVGEFGLTFGWTMIPFDGALTFNATIFDGDSTFEIPLYYLDNEDQESENELRIEVPSEAEGPACWTCDGMFPASLT